jgi:predicted nuclease of predicted toxin-antitoxin system
MRILLDECLPVDLRHDLAPAGVVETAQFAGLRQIVNGKLLDAMVGRFDVLVTADANLRYQNAIAGRPIAVLVLRASTNGLADLRPLIPAALNALSRIQPGTVVEV